MRRLIFFGMLLAGVLSFGISEAVQTKLVIRAKSKDAKFVGSKMGGALVIIKDSETGKVLAEGLTAGGTGDTEIIMNQPKTRFGEISADAAKFETSLDISEPRLITIDVSAPYSDKTNMIMSSTQMWLIPGRDIVGEGVIIEVPGFSVDAKSLETVKLSDGRAVIPVSAQIVMI
ncbi:MAG: hypothetical protein C4581_11435 [Nitrospiraceae bacterium]|nr:MAG: hypothetical protein C4581_11435 [Nitrospiraceae bacterium]